MPAAAVHDNNNNTHNIIITHVIHTLRLWSADPETMYNMWKGPVTFFPSTVLKRHGGTTTIHACIGNNVHPGGVLCIRGGLIISRSYLSRLKNFESKQQCQWRRSCIAISRVTRVIIIKYET